MFACTFSKKTNLMRGEKKRQSLFSHTPSPIFGRCVLFGNALLGSVAARV